MIGSSINSRFGGHQGPSELTQLFLRQREVHNDHPWDGEKACGCSAHRSFVGWGPLRPEGFCKKTCLLGAVGDRRGSIRAASHADQRTFLDGHSFDRETLRLMDTALWRSGRPARRTTLQNPVARLVGAAARTEV
jgi:hypothetical protein